MKAIFLIVFVLFSTCLVSAQSLSKEEERALKKELKKMTLEQFQAIKEESNELEKQLKAKQNLFSEKSIQNNGIQRLSQEKDTEIAKLQDELNRMGRTLTSGNEELNKGVLFRVQIGAYQNKRLAKALKKYDNFDMEDGDNGLKRYLVGKFLSYREAKNLAEDLNQRGAQAFVVGYIDGVRVPNLKQMPIEYINR